MTQQASYISPHRHMSKRNERRALSSTYTHAHSSILRNTQKAKATPVPISALGDKQNGVCNTIKYYSRRKFLHVTTWINSEDIMLCDTKGQILYDST